MRNLQREADKHCIRGKKSVSHSTLKVIFSLFKRGGNTD